MSDKLLDFMNKLNMDPALQSQFDANPSQSMVDFGVETSDIQMALNQDKEGLQKRCKGNHKDIYTIHTL